jgi:outer membrane murein-binding lipoprotein Lpp
MSMPYLHGDISREDADELLMRGGPSNGRFLLRTRPGKDGESEYILGVVFRDRPTHHLVSLGDDGKLMVNKRKYGNHTEIPKLLTYLSGPMVSGWPVQLTKGVATNGSLVAPNAVEVPPTPAAVVAAEPAPSVGAKEEEEEEEEDGPATPIATDQPRVALSPQTMRAEQEAQEARARANKAAENMAARRTELEALGSIHRQHNRAPLSPTSVVSAHTSFHSENSGPGEGSTMMRLNKSMAKVVIKLGARVSTLEAKVDQLTATLTQVLTSLDALARRTGNEASRV